MKENKIKANMFLWYSICFGLSICFELNCILQKGMLKSFVNVTTGCHPGLGWA